MNRGKRRAITVFYISALTALSLVAFSVASAQAAEWTIGGKILKEVTKEELTLGTGSSSDISIGGIITVHCKGPHTHTTIKESGISSGTIEFSSCEVQDSKGNSAAETCEVDKTVTLKVKALLSKDAMYDVFSSQSGGALTVVTIENVPGQKCLLIKESPETLEVTGTLGSLVSGSALLFSEAIATAAETNLKFGSQTAFVTGSVKQELIGPFKGKELGAVK